MKLLEITMAQKFHLIGIYLKRALPLISIHELNVQLCHLWHQEWLDLDHGVTQGGQDLHGLVGRAPHARGHGHAAVVVVP